MLTIKQKQTLEAIVYFINTNGYPPSLRELAELLKCDINTVFKKLMILEEKGYIKTTPSRARSIIILKWLE
jgi:repressor LexA